MIKAGAAVNLDAEDLYYALDTAIENEDPSTLKGLLDAGADPNAANLEHKTPLMLAAQNGKPVMIKLLIDAGADVNASDVRGQTALMYCDEVESVRVLLDAGTDLSLKNKDGETFLAVASKAGLEEIVRLLKSRGAPE